MLIAKKAKWPLWVLVLVELMVWVTLPVSLPIIIWLAMRNADREVRNAIKGHQESDQLQGEAL